MGFVFEMEGGETMLGLKLQELSKYRPLRPSARL